MQHPESSLYTKRSLKETFIFPFCVWCRTRTTVLYLTTLRLLMGRFTELHAHTDSYSLAQILHAIIWRLCVLLLKCADVCDCASPVYKQSESTFSSRQIRLIIIPIFQSSSKEEALLLPRQIETL